MKRCFRCQQVLPLDNFSINRRKYCLPSDKGRNITCIDCMIARSKITMSCLQLNFETNKFEKIEFQDEKEIINHFKKQKNESEN